MTPTLNGVHSTQRLLRFVPALLYNVFVVQRVVQRVCCTTCCTTNPQLVVEQATSLQSKLNHLLYNKSTADRSIRLGA